MTNNTKNYLLVAVIFALLAFVVAIYTTEARGASATRTHERADGFYVLEFEYNDRYAFVPAVEGAQLHYSAHVTIYKVVSGEKVVICEFNGDYIPGGCFEDDSDYLIDKCLEDRGVKPE